MANIMILLILTEAESISWDMAKEIINTQRSIMNTGIQVIIFVSLTIIALITVYNFILHKRAIKEAVDSIKLKIEEELLAKFKELEDRVETVINTTGQDIREQMKVDLKKLRNEKNIEIAALHAEKARVFAILNSNSKNYENAVRWWSQVITQSHKTDDSWLLRTGVEGLKQDLPKCRPFKQHDTKQKLIDSIQLFPEELYPEKDEIEKAVKKIPTEMNDGAMAL